MTNLQVFLECVVHRPHRVYGYKLRPLSLFHLAMLEQFAPTALTGLCTPRDLKLASCICSSRDATEFQRKSQSIWAWLANLHKFDTQVTRFADYLEDYLTLPATNESKDTTNNPFPSGLTFAAKLIKETGYDFERVYYSMAVSQIYWLVMALIYLEKGESNLISDKEREIYRIIEESKKVTA